MITILVLAYVQSIAFAMVSRARNRDSHLYHAIAAIVSNGVWFLTIRELVISELTFTLAIPYIIGTVAGSLTGAEASMRIERLIGAKS